MRDRLTKLLCCGAWVVMMFAAAAVPGPAAPEGGSVSLAEYRERISEAAARLNSLATLFERVSGNEKYEEWSRLNPEEDPARTIPAAQERTLGDVRRLLPPTQSVEWDAGRLTVSNSWLHAALEEHQKKFAAESNAQRAERVRDIAERLRALDARLGEYDGAAKEMAARDKDAEKGRLAAILRGPDFNKGGARGGAISDLMERIQRWLESLFNRGRVPSSAGTGVSTAAQIIIFALALGVFAFVMWRFWLTRRGRLSRVSLGREPRVILGEQIAPEETAADLLSAAEQLARAGDLRGAIRKAYVALLCELGDRNVIRLARHKTNRDYLQSVGQLAPQLYAFMRPLTLDFERHWYGFERATEDDWREFLTGCRRALDVK